MRGGIAVNSLTIPETKHHKEWWLFYKCLKLPQSLPRKEGEDYFFYFVTLKSCRLVCLARTHWAMYLHNVYRQTLCAEHKRVQTPREWFTQGPFPLGCPIMESGKPTQTDSFTLVMWVWGALQRGPEAMRHTEAEAAVVLGVEGKAHFSQIYKCGGLATVRGGSQQL